jgi:uncharacterized protein YegL
VSENRAKALPVYFVPDESGSMNPFVAELNKGLKFLLDAMHRHGMAAALSRFSIIGFSDSVFEHLLLADIRTIAALPVLSAHAGTSYESVFRALRPRIESDVRQLQNDQLRVLRPVVFFLTDGEPNPGESWEQALDELCDESFKFRPNVVAVGIGNAVASVILRVATKKEFAFIAATGTDTGRALVEFFSAFTQSIVASTQNLANGRSELILEQPEGFRLAIDVLPDD